MVNYPLSPKAKRTGQGYIDICPAHEDNNPSLSITETKDGKLLLHCFCGCSFEEIIAAAGLNSGQVKPALSVQNRGSLKSDAERTAQALSIWNTTQPIEGTVAETYLNSRQIFIWSDDMRFHPNLYYADDKTERPCLVCAVRRGEKFVGVHRTFLTREANKLGKKMLGPCGGGSVYVGGTGNVIAVAEGIENALSVRTFSGDANGKYFATLSATGMKQWQLPVRAGNLIIFPDGDRVGSDAALRLGERASLKGWNAKTMIIAEDKDWNDLLIAKQKDVAP